MKNYQTNAIASFKRLLSILNSKFSRKADAPQLIETLNDLDKANENLSKALNEESSNRIEVAKATLSMIGSVIDGKAAYLLQLNHVAKIRVLALDMLQLSEKFPQGELYIYNVKQHNVAKHFESLQQAEEFRLILSAIHKEVVKMEQYTR